jgi:hypothetical protein
MSETPNPTPEPTKEFYTKPAFIAAAAGCILMLIAPVFSFGGYGVNTIDIISHIGQMDGLIGILVIGAFVMFGFNAFLLFDNGKNESLRKSLPLEKRKKLRSVPLTILAGIIGYGLVDEGGDIFKVLGFGGFWLPFLAGIFLMAEEKIMGAIKK